MKRNGGMGYCTFWSLVSHLGSGIAAVMLWEESGSDLWAADVVSLVDPPDSLRDNHESRLECVALLHNVFCLRKL